MPIAKKEPELEIDEHISKRFSIQQRLGKGAYGIVWKAVDRKTKQVVAVKKIFDAFRNEVDAQRTFREVMFLRALRNHPNIVQLHSLHRAMNNFDIYLGFEYMETDLHNVIKKQILKDIHKRFIMYQLFKAVKYIHSGNVIHRDLKPSNILVSSLCRCKIADFGLARSLTQLSDAANSTIGSDSDPMLTDYVATRWYRAPEILIANRRYTKGIDMWSLGCILAEIGAGQPIFPGSSTVNQVELIMTSILPPTEDDINTVCVSDVSSSMIRNASHTKRNPLSVMLGKKLCRESLSLVNKLLLFNPLKRLTADEALSHPYVLSFRNPVEEIVIPFNVVIPFSDDIRLSVQDYRNKLYQLMNENSTREMRAANTAPPSRRMWTTCVTGHNTSKSKVHPVLGATRFSTTSIKQSSQTTVHGNRTKCDNDSGYSSKVVEKKTKVPSGLVHPCAVTKSYNCCTNGSKPLVNIHQPRVRSGVKQVGRDHSQTCNQHCPPVKEHRNPFGDPVTIARRSKEDKNLKKRITDVKADITDLYNSYNQKHGIINRSALLELRACGMVPH